MSVKFCTLIEIAEINYGRSPAEVADNYGMYPVIGTGGEFGRANRYIHNFGIVVPRKGSLGNPQIITEPFWPTDTTYSVIPNGRIDANWLFYSLLTFDLTKLNEATGVPSISRDWLSRIRLLVPEYEVQCKIANILKTVDRNIEETEALIEKYQQIKAGLMHDLFTRGIGADGKLRPPREQAPELYQLTVIGWIPMDWDLVKCDDVCTKIIDCKNRTPPICPDGHPVIRTPNVRNGLFVDAELVYTNDGSYAIWTARGKPEVGDIVITREAPVGEVCKIPARHSEACLGQRMMLYRTDSDVIENDFFLYALQSRQIQKRLDVISGGSTVGHVKVGDIRDLYMFLPNSGFEQERISEALNHASERIYSETEIRKKLGMKKSGLMQDLLTGKVPVKVPATEQATA